MIEKLEELQAALEQTSLEGREAIRLDVLDTREAAFAIRIEPDEVLSAWRVARGLVGATGRWPVVVSCIGPLDGGDEMAWRDRVVTADLFSRTEFEGDPPGLDVSPAAVIDRSRSAAVDPFVDSLLADHPEEYLSAESTVPDEHLGGHLEWFEPEEATAIILLPRATSEAALAYIGFFGAWGDGAVAFVALARRWREMYGAELVAHYGTMLEFVVEHPPASFEQACTLAREQLAFALCTTYLPSLTLGDHARSLVGRDTWFLHQRP